MIFYLFQYSCKLKSLFNQTFLLPAHSSQMRPVKSQYVKLLADLNAGPAGGCLCSKTPLHLINSCVNSRSLWLFSEHTFLSARLPLAHLFEAPERTTRV